MFRSLSETALHRIRLLAVILVAAGLAIAPDLMAERSHSLLDQATQIGTCTAQQVTMIWIDSHTIAAKINSNRLCVYDIRARSQRALPAIRIPSYWRDPNDSESELYDRSSINRDGTQVYRYGAISPDGRTLLWITSSGVVRVALGTGVSKQIVTYPAAWLNQWKAKWQYGSPGGYSGAPGGGPPTLIAKTNKQAVPVADPKLVKSMVWMADSRRWLSLDFTNNPPRWLRLRDYDGHVLAQMQINALPGETDAQILGFANGDTAVLKIGPAFYMTVDVSHRLTVGKTWTVHPPPDCDEAMLSPDGARILWYGLISNDDSSWLHPVRRRHYPPTQIIAVSDLDGANMREIGREDPETGDYANPHWLPDSKHATFILNDKAWSIAL